MVALYMRTYGYNDKWQSPVLFSVLPIDGLVRIVVDIRSNACCLQLHRSCALNPLLYSFCDISLTPSMDRNVRKTQVFSIVKQVFYMGSASTEPHGPSLAGSYPRSFAKIRVDGETLFLRAA